MHDRPKNRHLDMLALLSAHPAPIILLCQDLGVCQQSINNYAKSLRQMGLNIIGRNKTLAIHRADKERAASIAEAHVAAEV